MEKALCDIDSLDCAFFSSMYIEQGSSVELSGSVEEAMKSMIDCRIEMGLFPYLEKVERPLRMR
jgi:hypothetical protein